MREFVDGAEAIARGALDAGCDFFAGYPITPATPILLHMVRELPKMDGVAIQAEDEIASMGFCIGAAMTGSRVMTATSGPGISLYSENIGLAIMGEVPMVIVDVQRMGPSTGGATTTAQGDVQFLRWGSGGGYPVIVLAPATVQDCYRLTRQAFDLAERFRVPVFIATDKETVSTRTTIDIDSYEQIPVRERATANATESFVPYHVSALDEVPNMSPIGGAHIVRFTGSSHDERGYLTKNADTVGKLNAHLNAKIMDHTDEIALVDADLQSDADTLILSYGVTARAAVEAAEQIRANGGKVSVMTIYSLWPLPEDEIRSAMRGISRVIVPELNLGLYRREIERLAEPGCTVTGIERIDGQLITPEEIVQKGVQA